MVIPPASPQQRQAHAWARYACCQPEDLAVGDVIQDACEDVKIAAIRATPGSRFAETGYTLEVLGPAGGRRRITVGAHSRVTRRCQG